MALADVQNKSSRKSWELMNITRALTDKDNEANEHLNRNSDLVTALQVKNVELANITHAKNKLEEEMKELKADWSYMLKEKDTLQDNLNVKEQLIEKLGEKYQDLNSKARKVYDMNIETDKQ